MKLSRPIIGELSLLLVSLLLVTLIGPVAAKDSASRPYPDAMRFETDVQAFESQDELASPPSGAVLCIGSSSLRMWHKTVAADLHPLTVIPRGFGGRPMHC